MIVLKVDMLVKPGAEQKCREYIQILQEHSRKEPGCLLYIGHQSTENPRKFLFYEKHTATLPISSNTSLAGWMQSWSGEAGTSIPWLSSGLSKND